VAPSVWIYQPYQEKLDVAHEVHRVVLARGEGLARLVHQPEEALDRQELASVFAERDEHALLPGAVGARGLGAVCHCHEVQLVALLPHVRRQVNRR
jgi:hypothetical protein